MDQDFVVGKGDKPIRLVTMSQESAGDGLSDDQGDDRMTGEPGAGVRVRRGRGSEMNTGDFFAPAVGLAFDIDDSDDRTFFALLCGRSLSAVIASRIRAAKV